MFSVTKFPNESGRRVEDVDRLLLSAAQQYLVADVLGRNAGFANWFHHCSESLLSYDCMAPWYMSRHISATESLESMARVAVVKISSTRWQASFSGWSR